MIDLEELERPLPCPFCKRPPSHRQKPNDGRWLTDCNTVSCIRPSTGLQQTKAKALRLWNTQALIATAREVEGLRAALQRIANATASDVRAGQKGYVSRYGINGIARAALEGKGG